MMRKKNILVWSTALSLAVSACGPFRGTVQKGDKDFAQGEYQLAIQHYQNALKKGKNPSQVNYKLAEAYRLSNRLPQAEQYYKAAIDAGQKKEDAQFQYGMALKAAGKYEEAAAQLQQYLSAASNKLNIRLAQREIENLKVVPSILKEVSLLKVSAVPATNSAASEFGPAVRNGELIYAATREGEQYLGNGEGFQDLYSIAITDTATTGAQGKALGAVINATGMHEATPTFSNEGRIMIFARSNSGKRNGEKDVDLFTSQFKTGEWSEPRMLSFNDPDAWDATPAFSPDGRTLYFASDRRGGQGGNDIWKTTLDDNGRFSRPVNLGPEINTPGNEAFPFVAADSTLYIASDGHPGLGGLDLFRVEGDSVINLGKPINSIGDDFSIFFTGAEQGFFASNREGGQGGDDIYAFAKRKDKIVNFFVDGQVQVRDEKGKISSLPGARVRLLDAQGQRINEDVVEADGRFSFALDSASVYTLLAERTGYFAARQDLITRGKTPPQDQLTKPVTDIRLTATLTLTPIVKNKAIVVENIFYDYDKANIRPDAAIELDKLVQTLVDNPTITIELGSHTDSRGKDIYNQDLSQRRAQSAVDYIISKGIDSKRITAKGYGESRPVVKNAKTEAQHQLNRRTEFKVTRIDE